MTREKLRTALQELDREIRTLARRAGQRLYHRTARHPHHYATAGMLSVVLVCLGHTTELVTVWLYALFENVTMSE